MHPGLLALELAGELEQQCLAAEWADKLNTERQEQQRGQLESALAAPAARASARVAATWPKYNSRKKRASAGPSYWGRSSITSCPSEISNFAACLTAAIASGCTSVPIGEAVL